MRVGIALASAAGHAGAFLRHYIDRQDFAVIIGILSMSAAAWMLFGAAFGLAAFGALCWITAIISASLAAMLASKGSDR
jgi:hypothetical protein